MIRTIAGYDILGELGRGGMGVVYRARDRSLGRQVALKVVPPELASDPERVERIEREARALAALDHPNIVTVYSVEREGDTRFLTMALVEGRPLNEWIPPKGLDLAGIFDLALPIADALSAAHEKGITHRDLKPSNIMVGTDGRVRILDFGLAKLWQATSQADENVPTLTAGLTEAGQVLGTIPYMSPEQLNGEPVDHRSDIFSLGILLHELATGERPFHSHTSAQELSAILRDPPTPITEVRRDLPARLGRIVRRCLAKSPAERFQSARDVYNQLLELKTDLHSENAVTASMPPQPSAAPRPRSRRAVILAILVLAAVTAGLVLFRALGERPIPGPAPPLVTSLAVLPLENYSHDPTQEYFVDGMTEALIANLGTLSALRVISRQSVMRYKESEEPLPDIARDLGVEAVVDGSVLLSGDQVRIRVQLVAANPERTLWGETYDRPVADVLSVHDEVARAVADEIHIAITPGEAQRLIESQRVDPVAQESYLRGLYHLNEFTPEGYRRGLELLERSTREDSGYAPPHAEIAEAYLQLGGSFGRLSRDEAFARAGSAVERALELDDGLPAAHYVAGQIKLFYEWDWTGAEASFRRAIELNPSFAKARLGLGEVSNVLGQHERGIRETRSAAALDPLSPMLGIHLATAYLLAGELDAAVEQCRQVLERTPDFPPGLWILGSTYVQQGLHDEAIATLQRAVELNPASLFRFNLAHAYASAGLPDRAREILRQADEEGAERDAYSRARVHAALGEVTEALAALELAFENHSPAMPNLAVDPGFEPLRPEPEFRQLLRRLNLAD